MEFVIGLSIGVALSVALLATVPALRESIFDYCLQLGIYQRLPRREGYMHHCGWCGTAYRQTETFPRACPGCSREAWSNTPSVGVLAVPIEGGGYLLVERSILPQVGEDALPGGYQVTGESWQEAACRELFEETRIRVQPEEITLFDVISTPGGRQNLIFGLAPEMALDHIDVVGFEPTDETRSIKIVRSPVELAFASHTDVLRRLFAQAHRRPLNDEFRTESAV